MKGKFKEEVTYTVTKKGLRIETKVNKVTTEFKKIKWKYHV